MEVLDVRSPLSRLSLSLSLSLSLISLSNTHTHGHGSPASLARTHRAGWNDVCELDGLEPAFAGLAEALAQSPSEWREALYDSACPHEAGLPGGGAFEPSPFQRLLLLRCLTPDKLVPAIQASRGVPRACRGRATGVPRA
jgi:dynein heavy chain